MFAGLSLTGALCCAIEQETFFSLLSTGSTQETFRYEWKFIDCKIKNKTQTTVYYFIDMLSLSAYVTRKTYQAV